MRRSSWRWLFVVVCLAGGVVSSLAQTVDRRLIDATRSEDVGAVRALLKQRVNVNATTADGVTALHWAAQRNNLPLVDLLITAGANVKASNRYNITPLYHAALNGNTAMMTRLLDAGADANGASHEGQTMLMTAALAGKPDAVRLLMTRGARVDAVEPYKGQTALMWAASEGNAAAAEILIEAGADVKAKSKGGFTPFLFAVRNANTSTAEVLLKHGANVNDGAPDGTTALGMAVVNAYFELASVLLDRGADPNLPDPRASALHTVAWLRRPGADGAAGVGNTPHGPPPVTGSVTALQLAKKLLDKGANPNVRVEWREQTLRQGGRHREKSSQHPAWTPPSQLHRRHALLCRGEERRRGAHEAAGRSRRGPEDADQGRHHAAHGRGGPRLLGRREPWPFTGVSEAER